MTPEEILTREDLSRYLEQLSQEIKDGTYPTDHENVSQFLEAAGAWLHDMDGYFKNIGEEVPQTASWSFIGLLMSAATVYS